MSAGKWLKIVMYCEAVTLDEVVDGDRIIYTTKHTGDYAHGPFIIVMGKGATKMSGFLMDGFGNRMPIVQALHSDTTWYRAATPPPGTPRPDIGEFFNAPSNPQNSGSTPSAN
jgi:hypothetical protein